MTAVWIIAAFAAGLLAARLLARRRPASGAEQPVVADAEPVSSADAAQADDVSLELSRARYELDNLHLVNELSQKITASLSLEDSFQHVYAIVNSMMDAAVIELDVRYGEDSRRLFLSNPALPAGVVYVNHMAEWCFDNNRRIFLADAENDFARYVFEPHRAPDGRVAASVMALPVDGGTGVIGTLTVMSFLKNAFEPFHLDMVSYLLPFIAVAIKNAHHHRELNEMKQRAERSEAFMQQFLANMSHEIRTPIHAVTGMTQLLLDKEPREEQVKYLKRIRNASQTLLAIINDILDLSKIEANKLELERIDFSVTAVAGQVRDLMVLKAGEKGLNLVTRIDPRISPVLIGDPVRLTQVLLNLVGNAIKFTAEGKVEVSIDRCDGAGATGSRENEIFFSVSDTGIGMTEEEQKKLFRKYTQASPEISRKYGGTGLGLSIASQLVQLQGGTLEATSRPGAGSTFFFTLRFPVSETTALPQKEQEIHRDLLQRLEGLRILVTDDNEYNRSLVVESLTMKVKEIVVDEAPGGMEALHQLRRHRYDVVLMDLVMMPMDGFETTRRIRSATDDVTRNVPIIALTASAVSSEAEQCRAAGMNGFLAKPFTTAQLVQVIVSVLDGMSPAEPARPAAEAPGGDTIDLQHLAEIMDHDTARMERHLRHFLKKVPDSLVELPVLVDRGDYVQARVVAHSLKPLLSACGMTGATELAAAVEQACLDKADAAAIRSLLHELAPACERALEKIPGLLESVAR